MRRIVILTHGLYFCRSVVAVWSRHLAAQGMQTSRFGYPSMLANLDQNAERFADFVRASGADSVDLVGHSLGGLLILHMLERYSELPAHRVVLLGSPYHDSHCARAMKRLPLGSVLLGRSLEQWLANARPSLAEREVGLICGDRSFGAGLIFRGLPRPNDGTVSVAETLAPGLTDRVQLHVSHTEMLWSSAVCHQLHAFLRSGRFDHDTTRA